MFIVGLIEFVYKSILFIFASIMKLLLPDRMIIAWREWILNRAVKAKSDGSKAIKGSFVWNPLLKYPRNYRCYCGSDYNFKMCCLHRTPEVCSPREAFANKWAVKWAEKLQAEERGNNVELQDSDLKT